METCLYFQLTIKKLARTWSPTLCVRLFDNDDNDDDNDYFRIFGL